MVMGNTRVWSAGIYWEQNKFPNRTYFAPYAFKNQLNTRRFQVTAEKWRPTFHRINMQIRLQVEDLARRNGTSELYTNQEWYRTLRSRWSNYYDELEKFWLKMFFRSQEKGDDIYLRRYEHFPEYYRYNSFSGNRG